ncbi:NYN domain-containing protein [Nocardia transvalensis]|nr:NYN domain-containing protein [Nocardia transvalensis]
MADGNGWLLVVDAANVVGSRPDGWWRDRVGAARRLLRGLVVLRQRLPEVGGIVVVLEGAARRAVGDEADAEFEGLQVVTAEGSGDDAIVAVVTSAMARTGTGAVTVVTADRELRQRVEALGAQTVGPRWLWERVPPTS